MRSRTTTFAEYGANDARLVENVYLPFGVRVVATETICEEQAFRVISQQGNRREERNLRRSGTWFMTGAVVKLWAVVCPIPDIIVLEQG